MHLVERGHQVHLFSHDVPKRLATGDHGVVLHIARAMPYPVFESPPHNLAITSSVLKVHEEFSLDLLHAHYAIPNATSALVAQAAVRESGGELPVVTTLHGTDVTLVGCDPTYAPLVRYAVRASCATTAVSKALAERTERDLLGGEPHGLRVIPNFVHPVPGNPGAAATKSAGVCVLHASNFRPLKRVAWLIQAFALALEKTKNLACLDLVGEGPDRIPCEELVEQLGLASKVHFHGELANWNSHLRGADIFSLSSLEESFGLAALEAMAYGCPVVSTEVGGVGEVVHHGVTGLLSNPQNIEGFAQHLALLADDKDLRHSMGSAARHRAEESFSPDAVVSAYEALYGEVVAQ